MALLEILHEPHPVLRQVARPVEAVIDEVRRLVDDMAETMYASHGIGLAAPQVGQSLRIFVADPAGDGRGLLTFINPIFFACVGSPEPVSEGCLSILDLLTYVKRWRRVAVRALDRAGEPFELWADDMLAVIVQHENDHLDGILMTDHGGPTRPRKRRK